MYSRWILGLAIVLVALGCGSPHGRHATKLVPIENATRVGAPITTKSVTSLGALMTTPEKYVGQTLAVDGRVTGRCMGTGCWVSLDTGNPDEPFYAKSADHSFIFPEECVGRDVRIQGTLMVLNPDGSTSTTAQAHAAGSDQAEGEGHYCPQPIYFLNPTGVAIAP